MTRLEEAVAVAEEYILWRQSHYQDKAGMGVRPSCQDLVRELGRDMRPVCNGAGHAVAVAIIAAEWLALPP